MFIGGEHMKKVLALCTMVLCFLPFTVKAEEQVPVYLFHGEGCPHCEDALKYFNSLSEEEKSKFTLIKYEVWYNETNRELMENVALKLDETVSGVPYIVVGEKSFSGFDDSIGEAIMRTVNEMQESGDIIDIVSDIDIEGTEPTTGTDIETNTTTGSNYNTTTSVTGEKSNNTIVIIGVLGTIFVSIALLVFARKNME